MNEDTPQHKHECDYCCFLGRFENYDLYFCKQKGAFAETVIARFGELGDYYSGMCFASTIPPLGEAKRRAQAKGLISECTLTVSS